MKGRFSLVAVVLLLAFGFHAFASGGGGEASTAAGPKTLTIGTFENWYTPAAYASGLPIFKEIEKKTGITLKWDVVPPSQYSTSMQTRMAAGAEGLPDIINIPGDPVKWGTEGIIIALEDLIDKHAPNTKKFFAENPDVAALNVAPDGHTYKISSVVLGSTYINPYCWIVNKEWLDNLKLAEPDTIDDWYKVLKAFKERDPNGNKTADEIPLLPPNSSWYLLRWGEAWGLRFFYSAGFWAQNNKVVYHYLDPKFKELLTWLNRLYKEGLIDPEFLQLDSDKLFGKINRNIVGATPNFISNIPQFENNLKKAGFANAHFKGMAPPKGPYGDRQMEGYGPISGNFGITKACKDPVTAIKWMDYVYASPEGSDYVMFGIEGLSYVREGGKKKLTDYVLKNPDGMGTFDALRKLGSWPNVAYIQTPEAYQALFAPFPELLATSEACKPYITFSFPPVLPTPQESEKLSAVFGDLNTYRDEMVTKFILGQESLDKFDAFVQKLKDLGIDQIIAIKQAQYDRFQKSKAK